MVVEKTILARSAGRGAMDTWENLLQRNPNQNYKKSRKNNNKRNTKRTNIFRKKREKTTLGNKDKKNILRLFRQDNNNI